jgi:CspA family cold shock protein
MTVGTVKWFNEMKGFGFIQPDDGGPDAFVHITAVEKAGMGTLRENQRVAYDLQEDRPGKMSATNLRSADDAAQPQAEPPSDEAE